MNNWSVRLRTRDPDLSQYPNFWLFPIIPIYHNIPNYSRRGLSNFSWPIKYVKAKSSSIFFSAELNLFFFSCTYSFQRIQSLSPPPPFGTLIPTAGPLEQSSNFPYGRINSIPDFQPFFQGGRFQLFFSTPPRPLASDSNSFFSFCPYSSRLLCRIPELAFSRAYSAVSCENWLWLFNLLADVRPPSQCTTKSLCL